jgi:hypothetical protein
VGLSLPLRSGDDLQADGGELAFYLRRHNCFDVFDAVGVASLGQHQLGGLDKED